MQDWTADPEQMVERVAREIVERGLETPAILFLEMSKPLSFLLGQSVLVGMPALAPFLGVDGVESLSGILSRRESVEQLLDRIEELAVATP